MPDASNSPPVNEYESYVIQSNLNMINKIEKLEEKIKELETENQTLNEESDNMEKKLPYLRGLLVNEYESCKQVYEIVKLLMVLRKKNTDDIHEYIILKSFTFVMILVSAPIAWLTYIYYNSQIFSILLTANSICALIYFAFIPEFVFEKGRKEELPQIIQKKLSDYKKHRQNSNYLEELANNY